jgi:subtilisin family serine protease
MRTNTDASRPFDQKPALVLVAFLLVLGTISLKLQRVAEASKVQPTQEKLEIIAGHEVAANRVIVKYRSTKSRTSLQSIAQSLDADVDVELGGTGARLVHSNSRTAAALVAELSQRTDVLYAEPDYLAYGGGTPNDSFYASQQWSLHNTGQTINGQTGTAGADVSAQQAWDISTGDANQVVAILDSGIDYSHPDLVGNAWSAATPFSVTISGVTINCPAGSHGVNTITNVCDPLDDHNHGSNVSGIIGATGNNGMGVTGINWQAKLLAIKWLNSSNAGFLSDAIDALEVAVQLKQAGVANIKIMNNSWWVTANSQALLDEMGRVESNGMLFVGIAGNGTANDGFTKGGHDNDNGTTPTYPSNFNLTGMISVAATDNRDALAFFSNWGKQTVHIGAPGNSIFSTGRSGSFSVFSGTSQAAPHVAGAAALLLSRCNLTTAGLKGVLITSADPDSALTDKTTSGGRLNVARALSTCVLNSQIIDDTRFFVRQQYIDFLSREADASGFQFWSQGIDDCLSDAACREVKRINASAAFFLSIEFQQTGYLVYRIHKASFGNLSGKPVPITRANFLTDTKTISNGVVVLQPGWEQQLEANKVAFTQAFVQRAQFVALYPQGTAAAVYVDKLFATAGFTPTTNDRNAAITAYGSGDTAGRAAALRAVAENAAFQQQEFNNAFVLMEYFGYLQRDPDAAPNTDFSGYNFWLTKLNQANGNYIAAEMVKAFISASEYRARF